MTVSASEVRNDAPPAYSATDDTGQQTEAPAENLRRARTPRSWIATCALAAGLVLGVLLAGSFGTGSNIFTAGGTLRAGGLLAQRLSGEISGQGLGPSFWSREGVFCRGFDLSGGATPGLSGIACREPAGWRIRIITESDGSAGLPGSVTAVMNNLIVGAPLDDAQEAQARRQAWRPR